MAVVVAKAVAKRSVDRHLLKRRILSVLRPYFSEGRYVVVYAKKGALTLSFKALKEELAGLLSRSLR
jgi:ribonuclease P protein component